METQKPTPGHLPWHFSFFFFIQSLIFMLTVLTFIFSSRLQTWKECTTHWIGNPRIMLEISWNLPLTANPSRTGSSSKNLRWVIDLENVGLIFNRKSLDYQVTSTGSITIYWDCLSTEAFRPNRITCFWVTTSIAESSLWKPFACSLLTKSNIRKTSSCFAAITSVQA